MKNRKILFQVGLYGLVFSITTQSFLASSITDKKNELKETETKIDQYKVQLKETENQKNTIEEELSAIDTDLIEAEKTLQQTQQNLKEKQSRVDEVEKEIALLLTELTEKEEEKEVYNESTKKRMVQMYKNNNQSVLKIIFSSKSMTQALARAEYINRISNRDQENLNKLADIIKSIQDKKERIEEKEALLKQELANVEVILKKQETQKAHLKDTVNKKSRLITQLKQQEATINKQIDLLEEESKKIEKEIQALTAKSAASKYNGGVFIWPVPNYYRVSSDYGSRTSPISGRQEFHTGIDIPAPYGKDVLASGNGTVIYSGWRNGYGNTVMIDHGGGVVSLYAHNSSLVSGVGSEVKRGDVIAKIGSTGFSTGNHLHFEVRKNGAHISPWNYLSR